MLGSYASWTSSMFGGHGPHIPHVSRRRGSTTSSRKSDDGDHPDPAGEDDTTVVDEGEKSMLLAIISQLKPGADLSRISLPTFILEPRSMLERITNFMQHPETLLPMTTIDDPVERFVSVVKFYLSGWHLKPPGVKKPLNPILGEQFACYWDLPDKTRAYYIAEQTSHHPPKSSYFYLAPHHHVRIDGTLKPRSRFLGNSAASMMEGISLLTLTNKGKPGVGEKYILNQPNIYVRGILFGTMKYELGDFVYVRCPENHLVAEIEFRVKGFFTGTYNAIHGTIKNEKTGEKLYEISGKWNEDMYIKDELTGRSELLFDATNAKPSLPLVRPISEQTEKESQNLWAPTIRALLKKDQDTATDEKIKVEEKQRSDTRKREADGIEWVPQLFKPTDEYGLDYIIHANVDGKDAETLEKQVLDITPILPGSHSTAKFAIPPHQTHPSVPTNITDPDTGSSKGAHT
ncbi:Oxysterol-binding protein- protein 8 [Arthrobotrys megalospora]